MADTQIAAAANAAANVAAGLTPGQIFVVLILAGLLGAVGQGARAIVGLKKLNDEALSGDPSESELFIASRLNVSLVVGSIAGVAAGLWLGVPELLNIKADDVQLLLGIAAAGYAGVDFIEAFTRNLGGSGAPGTGDGPAPRPKPAPRPAPSPDKKKKTKPSQLRQNQIDAYRAAVNQGLSDLAARVLVADMTGESLAHPSDHHWDVHHMSQGIAQWDPGRAQAIQRRFGKFPKEMTVAEQTEAAIWEIRTFPRFAPTKHALENGTSAPEIMAALVRNYEVPANPSGEIQKRLAFYEDLQTSTDLMVA